MSAQPVQLPDEWRNVIVERLAPFAPQKIIVFGSRARGDARDDSDVDLLVVLDGADGRSARVAMRRALADAPFSKDIVSVPALEYASRSETLGSVVRTAVREGVVILGSDERDSQAWLRYAEEDLQAAAAAAERSGFAPRHACYLAQQAAEKAVKAVLRADGTAFPLTHDLERLSALVAPSRRVGSIEADLATLSEWSTSSRYPTDGEEATPEDAREAIAIATAVVEAARADIAK